MTKITHTAATREAAITLRHRLQAEGIPTGRRGCEIYFFAHTTWGYSMANWRAKLARMEAGA